MKRSSRAVFVVIGVAMAACLLSSCNRDDKSSSGLPTKRMSQATSGSRELLSTDPEWQRQRDLAMTASVHADTRPSFPLPNFPAGPGMPRPVSVNFYEQADKHPDYLCCTYDIQENHYDATNEPVWFASALLQIRGTGRERFPPVRWIAVIIANRAEHKGATTFEKSHKVGAVFSAVDVFDSAKDPKQLIAGAQLDRHPFFYDETQPTPGEQQRWMIVERHEQGHAEAVGNERGNNQKN